MKTNPVALALLIGGAMTFASAAGAQQYPAKPVRVIVPFPPGAGGDFVTRLFTPRLSEALGQQFIVDNRSGAAGHIGAESVARATADGYTLLTVSVSLAIGQSLSKNLKYDLARDFEPVTLLASTPYLLAVHPSVPVKNVKELIALARAQPNQLTFGSSGEGSGTHLAAEMLKMQARIGLLHVPYKGTAPAISDLVGGHLSLMFASQLMPQVRSGRLRAIATSSAKRSPMAPEIPTVAESGLPGYEAGTWFGLLAPARTPRDIVVRLNGAAGRLGQLAEIRDQLMAQSSAEPLLATPEQTSAYISSEVAKWRQVIAAAGMRAE
jgi:tripartite-type tricarboxylate transporter receptor subunit TctC